MDAPRLASLFRALAHANRLRIVGLLLEAERCGWEIQASLGLTQSNVSRHLSYLKHAGLVSDQRRGSRIFYRLSDAAQSEAAPLLGFLLTALRRGASGRTGRSGAKRRGSATPAAAGIARVART